MNPGPVLLALGLFAGPGSIQHAEYTQEHVLPAKTLHERIEAYLAPALANRDFSGVILIAYGDNVLLRQAYGKANYELAVPNTPQTRFHIASLTKTFTAAGIVILKERGLLCFSDRLKRFLPDFPNAERITIQHLLDHEAGVPNPDYESGFFKDLTLDEVINTLKKKPLDFEPGTKEKYSNGG